MPRGGKRPGAGKPKGVTGKYKKETRKTWGGRFAPQVHAFLKTRANASAFVENLIKKNADFKRFIEKNA